MIKRYRQEEKDKELRTSMVSNYKSQVDEEVEEKLDS